MVTNRWPRDLPTSESFEGIPVFRVPLRTPGAGLKSELTFRLTSRLLERKVATILREERTNLVHVQCVGPNAYYARLAAKRLRLPLVVSLQGELSMDATHLFERSGFARQTLRVALKEADFITACSQQTLAESEIFSGSPFRVESKVIHNGIRCSDFADVPPYHHTRPYVLALGRHVPQKGFDVLLRAMKLLWQDGRREMDLLLAGEGPESAFLKRLACELGISDRVVFPGRADRLMTAALFAGCEVFISPSRNEPFGIVNLEAMASGKPVIATRVGGVPEFIFHGETGWLVAPDDPRALAEAIDHVIQNVPLREQLTRNGKELALKHDWSGIADCYFSAYSTALKANGQLS